MGSIEIVLIMSVCDRNSKIWILDGTELIEILFFTEAPNVFKFHVRLSKLRAQLKLPFKCS